ncbi:MAG: aldehyde dehydrogenase family protein [Actinomycetales bacterium]|nr:aldehyde dehydrogenase family protein [Actinomycetales bacterium]
MDQSISLPAFSENYVDGTWRGDRARTTQVVDPASGDVISEQALAGIEDVHDAVSAANRLHASGRLGGMRPVERSRMLHRAAFFILEHREEIATTITLEQGKPLFEARAEVDGAARFFEYYGNLAESLSGRSIPLGRDYVDFVEMEPRGVVAHIIPWNYPFEMTARSLAPALATGNPSVIKTPELAPLSNLWYAHAAEHAGFPAGSVNLLCGHGSVAGAALASHPLVALVVFTGSVPTGVSVAHAAAENTVPTVLELGGKSAAVVFPDADLARVATDMRYGIFYNAGQTCSAMSRVIVHESRLDELLDLSASLATSLQVSAGITQTTERLGMGALVSADHRDSVQGMVDRAERDGARVVVGGRAPSGRGAFMEPTVVFAPDPSLEIAQEEVFGPVLTVLSYRDDGEAISIANGTRFGLVGGVYTTDIERALRTSRALRGGQIYVNEWFAGGVETPFGGTGQSGMGREKGLEGMMNYVQTKNIAIRL